MFIEFPTLLNVPLGKDRAGQLPAETYRLYNTKQTWRVEKKGEAFHAVGAASIVGKANFLGGQNVKKSNQLDEYKKQLPKKPVSRGVIKCDA